MFIISYEFNKVNYIKVINDLFNDNSNIKEETYFNIFDQILNKKNYKKFLNYITNDLNNYFYNISENDLEYISTTLFSYCILHFNNINSKLIVMYINFKNSYFKINSNKYILKHFKYYNYIINKYISTLNKL